jgi:1-phosphatidylinositol phosphodiesterase
VSGSILASRRSGLRDVGGANPSETVLIRLKEEYDPANNSRSFADTFLTYMDNYDGDLQATYGAYVWRPNGTTNPPLSQVRGKIIFMLESSRFTSAQMTAWGIPYEDSSIMSVQDNYNLSTNWDLYGKWESVKGHLHAADSGNRNLIYINYLSGSGGSFPYFVASGHSSPGTTAPRLSTGLTTPGWNSSYPDFPRVDCFIGICTIAFEGTNTLTKNYLEAGRVRFSGIVMADFPGDGLISAIISRNPLNRFAVRSQFNGKCLDMDMANSNVQVWDCHGGANQQWVYEVATGVIRSLASDKCLDAAAPYGNAYMGPCHYGANQRWDLLPSGEIRDRAHGQCLDIYAFNNSNGANVQMYGCNGASNQRWRPSR